MERAGKRPPPIPQVSPWIGEEEVKAVSRVVASGWLTEGQYSRQFSARLNALMGAPYGVFAPNGTLALVLGLLALGIQLGDEVLVPDVTFIASANALLLVGATPRFVDVTPDTFQLDVASCKRMMTPNTRAVMPVHLFGMMGNMEELMAFAAQHDLAVIEDAAQAIGVRYGGRHAGTFGQVGCFSFFADKTITTGEGGYVVCRDEKIYERLRMLRNHGRVRSGTFIHPTVGYNFRLTDIQAALGLAQLDRLEETIARKQRILEWYRDELAAVAEVRFLPVTPGSDHVPFRVVLICEQAHPLMHFLEQQGIQTRSSFYPLHRQPCFSPAPDSDDALPGCDDAAYPNALFSYNCSLLLPAFPTLTRDEVRYICERIKHFYA